MSGLLSQSVTPRASRLAYGAGIIVFGLVNASFGTFALQFQPVPDAIASWTVLAYASALVLVLAGALVMHDRLARYGSLLLCTWLASWIVLLHLPTLPWPRLNFGHVLPASELAGATVGAGLLSTWWFARPVPWRRAWLALFGVAQLIFGACHFAYIDITANMVPAALPERHLIAAATGVAHLLAGAAFLTNMAVRRAATLLALMYAAFLLLVCIPLLVAGPGEQVKWLMCLMTYLCGASAWVARDLVAVGSRKAEPFADEAAGPVLGAPSR